MTQKENILKRADVSKTALIDKHLQQYPNLYTKAIGVERRTVLAQRAGLLMRALDQMRDIICGAGVIALTDCMHITEPKQWVSSVKNIRNNLRTEITRLLREAQTAVVHMGAAASELEKDEHATTLERTMALIEQYLQHYGQYLDVMGLGLSKNYPMPLLNGQVKH